MGTYVGLGQKRINEKMEINLFDKITKVIERIQDEPLEKLCDPSYLEFKLLPELGLNDRHMDQYPSHLHQYCGIGIDSWQYPNQFSKYLHYLSSQSIGSYVEIGCHKGGTFIITLEYLSRFNNIEYAIAVDNWPREIINEYKKLRPQVEYITTSSLSDEFLTLYQQRPCDLILVDGDHSYSGVVKDYNNVKNNSRIIAFHDIKNSLCPGTQQIWNDVCLEHGTDKIKKWTDQYDEVLLSLRGSVMGIGLVHIK
jgi:hypothetical protein